MLKEIIKNINSKLINFLILSVVFLIPLYFSVFLKNNSVYELNKIVLFRVLILFLLLSTAIKIFFFGCSPRVVLFFFKKYLIIPLLFIFSLLIATLFSSDLSLSFYGLYSRLLGFENYLYFFLFFILLIINLKSFSQIKFLLKFTVISSFFVCLYGLIQRAGFDPLTWAEPAVETGRVFSTLGQPNFLASYLLLIIPLNFYFIFDSKKFLIKFLWIIVLLFEFICLFFTFSKAAWLGFIAALLFYFFVCKYPGKNDLTKKIKNKHIFFIITICLLVILSSQFINRIKDSFDLKYASAGARINYWKASMAAIKERTLFGYGLETQGEVLARYYKKDWAFINRVNNHPNRAHNLILDIVLTCGFAGLFFYGLLLFFFFKIGFNNFNFFSNKDPGKLSLLIMSGVFGYLISLMFGFSIVATEIYFWFFLAIIVVINAKSLSKNSVLEKKQEKKALPKEKKDFLIAVLTIVLLTGILFGQASKEIKKLIADHYFREFLISLKYNEYFNALKLYDFIKDLEIRDNYYNTEIAILLSDFMERLQLKEFKEMGKSPLREIAEKIDDKSEGDIRARAKIFTALEDYSEAEENFKRLISFSSEKPKVYREYAFMLAKKRNYKEAVENLEKGLMFLPDPEDPNISSRWREAIKNELYLTYKTLGDVYFQQKQYDKASENFLKAFKNNVFDIGILKKLLTCFYAKNDEDKVIWYNNYIKIRLKQN